MGILNRYSVRIQQRRIISIDAKNVQHAKQLGEQDVIDMEDSEKVKAQSATLTAENVGEEGGAQLDRFDVVVRFRRNIVLDAESNQNARYWAEQDQGSWDDTEAGSMQYQQVTFMKENTGTT